MPCSGHALRPPDDALYQLIAPGSEWRLHREWFGKRKMADLLGADFGLAEEHKLYACHDLLLRHKDALFSHLVARGLCVLSRPHRLRQRWTIFGEFVVIFTFTHIRTTASAITALVSCGSSFSGGIRICVAFAYGRLRVSQGNRGGLRVQPLAHRNNPLALVPRSGRPNERTYVRQLGSLHASLISLTPGRHHLGMTGGLARHQQRKS
jgi:hypothetical protein